MSKDDRVYLQYILECIERIEAYTEDGKVTFLSDTMVQDATLRNLHTLSESTQRLSPALKSNYAAIDWRSISGFRNVVVHNYLGVSLEQIWLIVVRDLPMLKRHIKQIVVDLG